MFRRLVIPLGGCSSRCTYYCPIDGNEDEVVCIKVGTVKGRMPKADILKFPEFCPLEKWEE